MTAVASEDDGAGTSLTYRPYQCQELVLFGSVKQVIYFVKNPTKSCVTLQNLDSN